jgi:F420-non-reducing hydrogenase large subunit
MSQVINIQPITRIEGHASIGIQLDDSGNVADARVNIMSLRGFEKFVEGKPAEELPRIVSRICGICPWMHHLASNKAVDRCFGVTPTPAGSKLRELMQTIAHAEDKLLHFFFLAAADFVIGPDSDYAVRNVIGIAKANPELAQKVVKMRQMAKMILEKFSSKAIHPIAGVPGGFSKPLLDEERRDILEKMRQILDFALFTIEFAKKDIFPKYLETIKTVGVINTGFIGTVDAEGALNLYDGKIRLMKADGSMTEFDAQDYVDYIGEQVVPYSYGKFPFARCWNEGFSMDLD